MTFTVFLFGTDALINIFGVTISGRDSGCLSTSPPLPLSLPSISRSLSSLLPRSPLPLPLSAGSAASAVSRKRCSWSVEEKAARAAADFIHSPPKFYATMGLKIPLLFVHLFILFLLFCFRVPAIPLSSVYFDLRELVFVIKPLRRRMSPLQGVLMPNSLKFLNNYIFGWGVVSAPCHEHHRCFVPL